MTVFASAPAPGLREHPADHRWANLVTGVLAMMVVAGALFVWPVLRSTPGAGLAESLAATQNAFAFFIITETLFVPLEAWLRDRLPRWLLVSVGGALVAVAALGAARAGGAGTPLLLSAVGGIGAGLVYGGTVAKVLARFTDRKALCVGVTAAACVGVLALALGAIAALSSTRALAWLVVLGAGQAAVILVATLFILYPAPSAPPPDY